MRSEDAFVYRLWGVNDDLLYVGCSFNPDQRLVQHRRKQAWASEIHRMTVGDGLPLRDARNAEARAIAMEGPKYNITRQHLAEVPPQARPDCATVLLDLARRCRDLHVAPYPVSLPVLEKETQLSMHEIRRAVAYLLARGELVRMPGFSQYGVVLP